MKTVYFRCPVPGHSIIHTFHFTSRAEKMGGMELPRTPAAFVVTTTPTPLPEDPFTKYKALLREVRASYSIERRYIVECPSDWSIEGVEEAVSTANRIAEADNNANLSAKSGNNANSSGTEMPEITKVKDAFALLRDTYHVDEELMLHPGNKRPFKEKIFEVADSIGIAFPNL